MFYMARPKVKKKSKAKTVFKIIFAVLTSALMLVIIYGVYVQKMQLEKLKEQCTESVSGICVEVTSKNKTRTAHKRRRKGSHSYKIQEYYTEYTSRIKYTVDGKEYQTLNVNDNRPYPKEGGSVTVYYDPADPAVCYIP